LTGGGANGTVSKQANAFRYRPLPIAPKAPDNAMNAKDLKEPEDEGVPQAGQEGGDEAGGERVLIPLPDACMSARVDYNKARYAVLSGTVRGERRDGRIYCDPADLVAWKAKAS
jgi:hypothetical protein